MSTFLLISELSARSGFPASTLRYYERVGLLTPANRSPAGYRLYDVADLDRLRFIDQAKSLGLPLSDITRLVAVNDEPCSTVRTELHSLLEEKSREVATRIRELRSFARSLDQAQKILEASDDCGSCGPNCACSSLLDNTPDTRTLLPLSPRPSR
ncbi:MerR family transcriptional regulator [Rhodococcus globerulus]|uniref:MerR family transcriptional regulator n=1 Tax=Rhodococcus globerulus TaxID=33008 RepID=UPI0030169410